MFVVEQVKKTESDFPENECNFKVSFEVKHEGGHYVRVKYDWMQVGQDGSVSQMDLDSGFFKEWNLI